MFRNHSFVGLTYKVTGAGTTACRRRNADRRPVDRRVGRQVDAAGATRPRVRWRHRRWHGRQLPQDALSASLPAAGKGHALQWHEAKLGTNANAERNRKKGNAGHAARTDRPRRLHRGFSTATDLHRARMAKA